MNPDSELSRFGLENEEWIGMLRDAEVPAELGSIGPYQLLREVGRGGQAVVYEARRTSDGARVAIKRLIAGSFATSTMLQRFDREVEAVSLLDHPNIVRTDGMEIFEGQPVLVMEWIDGVHVTEWARGRNRNSILELIRKVADAVAHAHRCGVIHRDLKPENILVDAADEPHVLDFGLAKWTELGESAHAQVTRTSQFIGTPAYSSPEQVSEDPRRVDARTDIYSLGVISYHLLLGKLPYDVSGGLRRVLETIATEDARRPRSLVGDFARDLEAILLKTLSKSREERYPSMDLFIADLDRFLSGDPVEAESLGGTYLLRKFVRKNRIPVAIVAAFVLLSVGFGITMTVLYNRAEAEAGRVAKVEEFLGSMLAPEGSTSGSHAFTVIDLLDQASARLEREEIDDPDVEGRLHLRLASNFGAIWKWPEAARHAGAAVEIYRDLGDRQSTAQALLQLGLASTFMENSDAVAYHEEALTIWEEIEGPQSHAVAATLGMLAFATYRAADPPDHEKAEAYYARALDILSEEEEPSPLLAGTCYSHAVLAVEQGDFELAETRYLRALEIYQTIPKGLNVTGSRCMEDYAKTLAALGRVDDARIWVLRSREGRALDPTMCMTSSSVGHILSRGGNDRSAVEFYLESLSLTCNYLAAERPEHSTTFGTYAESIASGELDYKTLIGIGERCQEVDQPLFVNWAGIVAKLETFYTESDPALAKTCRRVLDESGAEAVLTNDGAPAS